MEKMIDLIDLARRLNGIPEKDEDEEKDDPDAHYCPWCGGSGGGSSPFQCRICRGTGWSWVHDQELIDRRAEEMRDRKIDDELMKEGRG